MCIQSPWQGGPEESLVQRRHSVSVLSVTTGVEVDGYFLPCHRGSIPTVQFSPHLIFSPGWGESGTLDSKSLRPNQSGPYLGRRDFFLPSFFGLDVLLSERGESFESVRDNKKKKKRAERTEFLGLGFKIFHFDRHYSHIKFVRYSVKCFLTSVKIVHR